MRASPRAMEGGRELVSGEALEPTAGAWKRRLPVAASFQAHPCAVTGRPLGLLMRLVAQGPRTTGPRRPRIAADVFDDHQSALLKNLEVPNFYGSNLRCCAVQKSELPPNSSIKISKMPRQPCTQQKGIVLGW
jgi:hypothetical protein